MDKPKVFIDGREGTTGLQLWERLSRRTDLELLRIGEARRKDPAERKKYLNAADLVFLCLPDAAAWEAVELIENGHTRIIDASTAHRTASGWVYGFPELYKDPERIIGQARRVANPGCHATGFLASAAPLSALHILLRDCPLTCFSLTGYSGGGRKMIAQYEAPDKPAELFSPRLYGTGLRHKHLTEMQKVAGLEQPPVFCPVVDDYYKGMATTIQLHNRYLRGQPTAREVCHILAAYYARDMGVPIQKLICASNSNNVLTDFLCTGVYDRNRTFYNTMSPSMDILISSNLERLLFSLSNHDDAEVRGYMEELARSGRYEVSPAIKGRLEKLFAAGFCDDDQTQKAIGRMWQEHRYLIDPHTAVAFDVLDQYRRDTGDTTPTVVVSTASPFKFCDSVLGALGVSELAAGTAILDQLSQQTGVPVPAPLAVLKDKTVRFGRSVTKEHMVDQALEMLR